MKIMHMLINKDKKLDSMVIKHIDVPGKRKGRPTKLKKAEAYTKHNFFIEVSNLVFHNFEILKYEEHLVVFELELDCYYFHLLIESNFYSKSRID